MDVRYEATSSAECAAKAKRRSIHWRIPVALAVTYVLFGSGAAATAAAIKTIPPFLMVGLRGLLAGAILTGWSLAAGATRPTMRQLRAAAIIGALIIGCGSGSGAYGQLTVPSGIAGVLSALTPLFAVGIGYALFSERPSRQTVTGLILGLAGIAMLLRPGSNLPFVGVLIIVAGQFGWAVGAELAPRIGLPDDPRLSAGLELLIGGAGVMLVALIRGGPEAWDWSGVSLTSWLGFAWFVVIAIGGFTAFGFLAQTVTPAISTTFAYVSPVVALTLGWLLYGEPLMVRTLISTAVTLFGVCLIVSAKRPVESRRTHHPMTSGHGHARRALMPAGSQARG